MDLETLRKLAGLSKEIDRETMYRPWTVPWKDSYWTLATDGNVMLFAKGEIPESHPVNGPVAQKVLPLLRMDEAGRSCTAADLKAWAGAACWSKEGPCRECGAKGRVPCPDCTDAEACSQECLEADGTVACPACEGKGRGYFFPVEVGRAGAGWFNRNYVACVLESVPDAAELRVEVVSLRGGLILVATGPDFRAWVMGLLLGRERERELAQAPLFECPRGRDAQAASSA